MCRLNTVKVISEMKPSLDRQFHLYHSQGKHKRPIVLCQLMQSSNDMKNILKLCEQFKRQNVHTGSGVNSAKAKVWQGY